MGAGFWARQTKLIDKNRAGLFLFRKKLFCFELEPIDATVTIDRLWTWPCSLIKLNFCFDFFSSSPHPLLHTHAHTHTPSHTQSNTHPRTNSHTRPARLQQLSYRKEMTIPGWVRFEIHSIRFSFWRKKTAFEWGCSHGGGGVGGGVGRGSLD